MAPPRGGDGSPEGRGDGSAEGRGDAVTPVDRAIADLAEKQGGHVSRKQLRGLGLGSKAIDYRIKTGRLIQVYPGVYAVGHLPALPLDRAKGALLACGPQAALSHGSAAAFWGFEKLWPQPVEVVVLLGGRRPAALAVHRSRTLTSRDLTTQNGVRTTSPARTALDIAPHTEARRLTRLVNDARLQKTLTLEALDDVVNRNQRHPGTKRLKPLIEDRGNPTRSAFEDDFKSFCKSHGLPTPHTNVKVAGYEVDALFPEQRVIVELDGYETHRDKTTFERDRIKDADTLAAGFATVRLTRARLRDDEAGRLQGLLAKRAG